MNFVDFHKALRGFTVFSLADIRQLEPEFHRRRLNEWQQKDYITKLVRGHYIFCDQSLDENALFEIANRIYAPSYVSFEMALAYHGLIPESVYGVTSASTRKTIRFATAVGDFLYRTIHPRLYFGYEIVADGEKAFKMASPEKALLDLLYIKPQIRDEAAFAGMRVDRERFEALINRASMNKQLERFGQKILRRRVADFFEYIGHA